MFGHLFKRQYESVATEEGYMDEYSAVPMSDMKADFTSCSTHARRTGDYERQGSGRSSWAWSLAGLLTLLNVALSCWSTTVFFIQPRLGKYLPHIAHNNMDAHHGSLMAQVAPESEIRYMNSSFFGAPASDPESIYRQMPSPAVDQAWDRITAVRWFFVDRVDIELQGKDPSLVVKAPAELTGGAEKYIAEFDVQHQLHCLNEVRKVVYYDYYYSEKFGLEGPDDLFWLHMGHCIDSLRQTIQCQANMDLVTNNWVQPLDLPWPDFNVQHMCRNHDAILAWQEANQFDDDQFDALRKPEGAKLTPMEEGYFKMFPWKKEGGRAAAQEAAPQAHGHGHHHH